jgi:hypothetical protein
MDEFEKRLKRDAEAIEARVSPAMRARIDASLQGTEPVRKARRKTASTVNLWWASSLTGLAAAVIVIALVNWNRPAADVSPAETFATETELPTEPELPIGPEILDIRTADFTSPLEQELINLQSDIEKARESVRKDLDFTF